MKSVNLTRSGHHCHGQCQLHCMSCRSWNWPDHKHCTHCAQKACWVDFCMPHFSSLLWELWEFWLWTCAWWTIGVFSTQSNMLFASDLSLFFFFFLSFCIITCVVLCELPWESGDFIPKGFFVGRFLICLQTCVLHVMFICVAHLAVRKARPANKTLLYFSKFWENANESRNFTAWSVLV